MIKNERQYKITKARAEDFGREIEALSASNDPHSSLKIAGLEGQLTQFEKEILEYESLKEAGNVCFELQSLRELPEILIKARIARGMSQKELAIRLGIKEQQVQRYEATDYAAASMSRVREVANILGVTLNLKSKENLDLGLVLGKLNSLGISRKWIVKKLLPREYQLQLTRTDELNQSYVPSLVELAAALNRVFGRWLETLIEDSTVHPDLSTQCVKYKLPKRADHLRTNLYTQYVLELAKITLRAAPQIERGSLSRDFRAIRQQILRLCGRIDFESVLLYVWSIGVAVLPLRDQGYFHGACLRIGNRNIIVLKQTNLSPARWLFDLLHELFHTGDSPRSTELGLFEEDPLTQSDASATEEEANAFATEVIFDGRSDELLDLAVDRAGGNVKLLKQAVVEIAEEEEIDVACLANLMAYRLSKQGINWWATANVLQSSLIDPLDLSVNILMSKLRTDDLDNLDKTLLLQAFSEEG